MKKTTLIEERFCGPLGMANGGYVSGILAQAFDSPAGVALRRPVPVERPVSLERLPDGGVALQDGDEELPHLIVNVETTSATFTDYEMTSVIQNQLAERDLLPGEHLVDSQSHKVDLIGPVAEDPSWQAQVAEGFEGAAFVIDWENQVAYCPQGDPSHNWSTLKQNKATVHTFRFYRKHCMPCPVRAKCTKAANSPRSLTVQTQAAYEALQAARQRQKEETFREQYAARADVEGTVSQGVTIADLRRARCVGLAKT